MTVAAPDGERSGASAAMSALAAGSRLLVADRALDGLEDVPTVAVQASPAMIVFVGTHGAFGPPPPGIVLAGINRGPNIGRAILHSGTVGAALTAASAASRPWRYRWRRTAPGTETPRRGHDPRTVGGVDARVDTEGSGAVRMSAIGIVAAFAYMPVELGE